MANANQLRDIFMKVVEESGLSHRQIAKRSGLHHSTISHIMRGRGSGTLNSWDLILEACGVEIGYRFKKEENR